MSANEAALAAALTRAAVRMREAGLTGATSALALAIVRSEIAALPTPPIDAERLRRAFGRWNRELRPTDPGFWERVTAEYAVSTHVRLPWTCRPCRQDDHEDCKGTAGGDTCVCIHGATPEQDR